MFLKGSILKKTIFEVQKCLAETISRTPQLGLKAPPLPSYAPKRPVLLRPLQIAVGHMAYCSSPHHRSQIVAWPIVERRVRLQEVAWASADHRIHGWQ